MNDEDRWKAWSSYADISRKWATTMDAKAGFLTALNMGLLALIWSGARIQEGNWIAKAIGAGASTVALLSILCAIWSTLPRETLASLFGKGMRWHEKYKPISYYGYVATAFEQKDIDKLKQHVDNLTHADLAAEALEQHFVISRTVVRKSGFVKIAGGLLMVATTMAGLSVLLRLYL